MWSKISLFLESNWVSFLSICVDRPGKAWRRALIGVSLDMDKFVKLPSGKILFPFKFESLKSYAEDMLGSFRIGLKATYMLKCSVPFSEILMFMQVSIATSPLPLPLAEALLT